MVYTCGPKVMMKGVAAIAADRGISCYVSMEERMGCGVGACLGCVTRTTEEWPVADKRNGLVQTCNHGPVFWANQIEL